MPMSHALETVRAILIQRLDDRLEDIVNIVNDVAGDDVPDRGTRERLAVRVVQQVQAGLFPEEFQDDPDGYPWPDDGRMVREKQEFRWSRVRVLNDDGSVTTKRVAELVTVTVERPKAGLVPRLPTMATYARYLEKGKESPAAALKLADGAPVLTPADLAVLGERIERREAMAV